MLTGLVVAISTVTWAWEHGVDLSDASGVRTHMSCLVTRIASAEIAPPAESTAQEVKETTPPTDPAAPAGPASEESQPLTDTAVSDSHLDLDTLEQRLRQTDAIGFFTKLSLRNQIDDLLGEFHAYHRGRNDMTIEQLWECFHLLLFKLVALLEDGDPELARQIQASREALWGVFIDPEKFHQLTG